MSNTKCARFVPSREFVKDLHFSHNTWDREFVIRVLEFHIVGVVFAIDGSQTWLISDKVLPIHALSNTSEGSCRVSTEKRKELPSTSRNVSLTT